LEIFWSKKLKLPNEKAFLDFVQKMANRLMQGYCRYGGPDKRHKYLSRLELELKEYKKTGNAEHLINIANYCHLECFAPENKRFHFDNTVDSATRDRVL
jgi:hypothetical protein